MSNESSIIVGQKSLPFSWLPNYLVNDPNVSAEALAVALYLHGKPEGWRARPTDIRNRFKWGKHTWLKVSKELKGLNILHETKNQSGTTLTFNINTQMEQSAPADFRTVRKPTVGKSDPIERKSSKKKDIIKTHDHELVKQDGQVATSRPKKPPIKIREMALTCDEHYMYEKLKGYTGIFPSVALAIAEQNTVGDINALIEVATREGVENPGKYIVKCLYRKPL